MLSERRSAHYHRLGLAIVAAGGAACAATWFTANAIYVASKTAGWITGLVGCALPAAIIGAYILWLRRERRRGHAEARVEWMLAALAIASLSFVAILAFSLM